MLNRHSPRLAIAALSTLLILAAAPAANGRRGITETDLLDFVWAADPQLSPDGRVVAFVRVEVDRERDAYRSSIWIVPADGSAPPRPMTTGADDTTPRWSPDGLRLAFVRPARTDERTRPAQVLSLDLGGGEPVALTALPEGVSGFTWAPDGRHLAVTTRVRGAQAVPAEPGRPRASEARVITRATFRADGAGFVDQARRSRVFLVALSEDYGRPGGIRPVGQGRISDQDAVWSPDSRQIYFTAQTAREPEYGPPRVVLVEADVATGHVRDIASIDGTITRPAVSPDGTRIAFIGILNGKPLRSYNQPDLFVLERASGEVTNLTETYDYDVGAGLSGDQRAPRGSSSTAPVWTADAAAVLAVSTAEGRTNLLRFDARTGGVTTVTDGAQEVQGFTASRDGRLALVASTAMNIGDIFVLEASEGSRAQQGPRRVTDLNAALFSAVSLTEPEEFWYRSFDGARVHGWVLKPPGFAPSRTHPMILQIHGGPHASYGATFTHEFHFMAAKGYVVVYTNPRGSSGYGQQFGNSIQYRYPGDDHRDLMAAVDEVLARGYVDRQRLGVTGGSGGGLLTNWALTQTTRFKAAVSQRSIADWESWWYAADFTLFNPTWFRAAPWQEPRNFKERSPIRFVDRITTPLMLVDGDDDYRTPPAAGGEAMFRALKLRKVPVVMVRFPDEGHDLSRSGHPWRRVDRLRHIVGWFDKWLMGVAKPEYDVP